jgi:ABC-type nitrate/sulfonate/bicarbonate transport system substrate-binding protein
MFIGVFLAFIAGISSCVAAEPEATLRVQVFPGAVNIPIIVGIEEGIFAKQGLKIELTNTPDSDSLRSGLADGKFEIAHAGVDNAIAMVETSGKDAVIVLGGDHGLLEFIVRPEIGTFADVRGKVVAVDAPNTAYALVAKKILKMHGLAEGTDYRVRAVGGTLQRAQAMVANPELVAGMLNPPFSITVRQKGLKSLGRARSFIGSYQATGGFVMRAWAASHPDVLERYIAAYIESVRWVMNPSNREGVEQALTHRFKLEPKVAEETLIGLLTPGFGLAPDAQLDMDGLHTVLALRAEIEGQWGGNAPPSQKYVDLSYYDRALKRLASQQGR